MPSPRCKRCDGRERSNDHIRCRDDYRLYRPRSSQDPWFSKMHLPWFPPHLARGSRAVARQGTPGDTTRDRRVPPLAESSAARTLPFLGYLGASAALPDWTHSWFAQCWLAPRGGGLVLNARRTKPYRKQALNGEGGLPHSTRIERGRP